MPKKKTPTKKPAAAELKHIAEPIRGLAEPIEGLELDPGNARKHSAENLAAIRASLKEFGQVSAVVVNSKNGQVVIGNGRLLAARELGWKYLAVVRRPFTVGQQRALSLADNRSAELAHWDLGVLEDILVCVKEDTPDLYADLALADLELEAEEEEQQAADQPVPDSFSVVVECADEEDQQRFYDELQEQGRKCRLLTM